MSRIAVASVSGGKDSQATLALAIDRHGRENVRAVMADTGHEHPLTIEFAAITMPKMFGIPVEIVRADFTDRIAAKRRYIAEKWPGKGVDAATVERALAALHPTGVPFLDLCLWKGRFPSRNAQFCTQELKRYPLDRYMLDLIAQGYEVESWQGVRRDESRNRKDALDREQAAEGWWIERPIAGWSAADVFGFLAARGMATNPLYRLGCKRVGCMPCINASKDEILIMAQRWPEHVDRVREYEALLCAVSKRGWTTFFCDAAEEGESDAEILHRLSIDSRIEWAKTSRGGVQYDLLRTAEPAACSSVYGLCE